MDEHPDSLYLSRVALVARQRLMSLPRAQFEAHLLDEARAMLRAVEDGLCFMDVDQPLLDKARSIVQRRWQASGLWWWDPQLRSPPADAQWLTARPCNTAPCSTTAPLAVFALEMGVRRWRLGLRGGDDDALAVLHTVLPADVNDAVYSEVRADWERRGIWDRLWRTLPGQLWKHQRPLGQLIMEELGELQGDLDVDQVEPLDVEIPGGLGLFEQQSAPCHWEDGDVDDPPPVYQEPEGDISQAAEPAAAGVLPQGIGRTSRRGRPETRSTAAYWRRQRRRYRARSLLPANPFLGRERAF